MCFFSYLDITAKSFEHTGFYGRPQRTRRPPPPPLLTTPSSDNLTPHLKGGSRSSTPLADRMAKCKVGRLPPQIDPSSVNDPPSLAWQSNAISPLSLSVSPSSPIARRDFHSDLELLSESGFACRNGPKGAFDPLAARLHVGCSRHVDVRPSLRSACSSGEM